MIRPLNWFACGCDCHVEGRTAEHVAAECFCPGRVVWCETFGWARILEPRAPLFVHVEWDDGSRSEVNDRTARRWFQFRATCWQDRHHPPAADDDPEACQHCGGCPSCGVQLCAGCLRKEHICDGAMMMEHRDEIARWERHLDEAEG